MRGDRGKVEAQRPTDSELYSERLPLLADLRALRADLLRAEERSSASLTGIHPSYAASARNLVHYLAFRRHDLRALQARLTRHGLSSLGRAEAHVLATVEAVIRTLADAAGASVEAGAAPPVGFAAGERGLGMLSAALERTLAATKP